MRCVAWCYTYWFRSVLHTTYKSGRQKDIQAKSIMCHHLVIITNNVRNITVKTSLQDQSGATRTTNKYDREGESQEKERGIII